GALSFDFQGKSPQEAGLPRQSRGRSERDRNLHGIGVAADRGVLAGRDAAVGGQLHRRQRRGEGRDRLGVGRIAAPRGGAAGVLVDVVAQAQGGAAVHLAQRVGAARTGGRVAALVERGDGGGGAAGAAHADRAAGVQRRSRVGVGRIVLAEGEVGGADRAARGDVGGDLEAGLLRRRAGEGAAGGKGGAQGEEQAGLGQDHGVGVSGTGWDAGRCRGPQPGLRSKSNAKPDGNGPGKQKLSIESVTPSALTLYPKHVTTGTPNRSIFGRHLVTLPDGVHK